MEGDRDSGEDVLTHGFVVESHVQKHGFLVTEVEIVLQLVVYLHRQLVARLLPLLALVSNLHRVLLFVLRSL